MTKKQEAIVLVRNAIPLNKEVLKEAEKLGMIAKKDLKDYTYYKGSCRNASIAMWDKRHNVFVHLRVKFSNVFSETINHPEDDDGYDIFVPVEEIDSKYD